jgi:hypothetical protein
LFHDSADGGFFTTGSDAEVLVVRAKNQMDNATPAENSLAAHALARLGALTAQQRYLDAARQCIDAVAAFFSRHPSGFADAMEAAEVVAFPAREVVVVGAADDPATHTLWAVARQARRPGTVTLLAAPDAVPTTPLLDGRVPHRGRAVAYVCEHHVCTRPTGDPVELAAALSD